MLLRRTNRNVTSSVYRFYQNIAADGFEKENSEQKHYPLIQDESYQTRKKRKQSEWHKKIEDLKIVEEKLLEINMPKYYGYKCTMFNDKQAKFNSLNLIKKCTSTVFHEIDYMPDYNKTAQSGIDSFLTNIKSQVEDAIRIAFVEFKYKSEINQIELSPQKKEEEITLAAILQLNRTFLNSLSADFHHLKHVEIDLDARQEAFWFVNGINPPESMRRIKRGVVWQKNMADDSVPHAIQYLGNPYLALRNQLPLEPFSTITEDIRNVPKFQFDPRTLGYTTTHRHGTTIPGFWPGSMHEHAILSYQNRSHLTMKNVDLMASNLQDMLHGIGIQSSFAWLYGVASYMGFSSFTELKYPLTTQTIVTNGRLWSFYRYQLNSTIIDSEGANAKVNQCWGTKEMNLFEEVDEKGKIIGLNDDVLKNIYNFYSAVPKERKIIMKPYLGQSMQTISDISDDDRRIFLERVYKHMTSNRPRHRLTYEIYNWEKIYKVDHNTRPLAAKRRPFELKLNPYKRRMNEHTPMYIPKVKRQDGPKSKNKWEKTFYP